MKKSRPASKTGQSTTGGRLPRWRGALLDWSQILTLRDHKSGTGSVDEIQATDRAVEAAETNLTAILHEAVLERFRAERDMQESSVVDSNSRNGAGEAHNSNSAAAVLSETSLPRSKRIFDLGILACTALVWLPLMALLMALVKIVSPGPAFYRQRRVGFRGKEFMIFKLRSMHVNADTRAHEQYVEHLMEAESPMTKLDASDPRLIRCGRFLRATGLDELPQLFNILRGEMSLVGPRPCTVVEFQRYRPEHRARVNAQPGLTGLWQVNGKNRTTFSQMIKMDIFYTENVSLMLDLNILWRTLPAIVRQTRESSAAARARNGTAPVRSAGLVAPSLERFPERT